MKPSQNTINDIRAFNRFYTDLIGLLNGHLLDSEYSLAEARILYEINSGKQVSATQIMSTLNIDKGYLSRILKKFEKKTLITKRQSADDARIVMIALTDKGAKISNQLSSATNQQIDTLIGPLPAARQRELVQHMQAIKAILAQT